MIDLGLGHVRIGPPIIHELATIGSEYGPAEGFEILRQAVASWEQVPLDNVALTTGASLGLVATLATLERPASILCPRPYYPAYPKVADILGLRVIYYDLLKEHDWEPDLESLGRLARDDTRAVLWNFPSNPTGAVSSNSKLEELHALSRRRNLLVVSDEVYADFVYDGVQRPDVRRVLGVESVVRLRSFSKVFGIAGERLGYVIAAPWRLREITRAHWSLGMSPPTTAQTVAYLALQSNPIARVDELNRTLVENRSIAVEILRANNRFHFTQPNGGVFLWLQVEGWRQDSRKLADACSAKLGVRVMPGAAFGVDEPIYLRVSFAVPKAELTQGCEALVASLPRASAV